MLNKLFGFLGFNTSETIIGLAHLTDNQIKPQAIKTENRKKEMKLSDLMRGN